MTSNDSLALTDDSGFTLNVKVMANGRFAGEMFNVRTLNNLPSLSLRDDDVILCSYAKSGCHWIWQNIRMLLEGEITHDAVDKESSMCEMMELSDIDSLPAPRLLNTHAFFDTMPRDLLNGKTKIVFLYRNPKDIAVSFCHHHKRLKYYRYGGDFSHYLKRFATGLVSNNSVFDYWTMWEEGLGSNPQIPCHVISFEEFKLNPISARRRLAEFLGRSYSDHFLREVETATDIGVMKGLKGRVKDDTGEPVFYRKGEIGDWKNYFTVCQDEWFDDLIESRLGSSKLFKFVYSGDLHILDHNTQLF